MCFSLAKKIIFTLKNDPFFERGSSTTIFLGFCRKRSWHTVETMTHFASPVHVSKTYNNLAILFFVCHLEFMQIWTECPVLKKVEIILFFGSEKLNCTNDFPNYANFEG